MTRVQLRAILTATLALMLAAAHPPRPDADIVVIGAGIAGLSAALEASTHGASVIVVDTSSVFGGHAVMSGGLLSMVDTPMQRAQGIHDSPALATQDFIRWVPVHLR